MELIIDVQGLKIDTNEIAFKELAVIDVNESDFPSTYLFKPPCKWDELCIEAQRENTWLYENYHGLHWNSGHILYDYLDPVLDEIATYEKDVIVLKKIIKKDKFEKKVDSCSITS